jgi:Membrane proteins related to metalloendopeptidases
MKLNLVYEKSVNIKIAISVIVVIFIVASSLIPASVFASESEEELQQNLEDISGQIDASKEDYHIAKTELDYLLARTDTLKNQVTNTETIIAETESLIGEYNELLSILAVEIEKLETKIRDQEEALGKRLRIMYQLGDSSIYAVLLGSENFLDFLTNFEMIRLIHESDQTFLAELQATLDSLDKKNEEARLIESMLSLQLSVLVEKKSELSVNQTKLDVATIHVQEVKDAVFKDLLELEKESKRIERELADYRSSLEYDDDSLLIWPCRGVITSEYGMRVNPVHGAYVLHAGIDIGVPMGTPIAAAGDGVVIFVGESGGYGNLVMIDHGRTDDGQTLVTCYAHNSGFAVADGQSVSKGDVIAYAGSTGNSTGSHCHFEIRINGTPQDPREWLPA